MFTSIEGLKVNINDYSQDYAKNFKDLINQKDKDRTIKINQIMSDIKDKNIFDIKHDEHEETIYNHIKTLLEVKPGRLLIKTLIEIATISSEHTPIPIRNENRGFFHHDHAAIDIDLRELSSDNDYNAVSGSNGVKCSRPTALTLAHELIHALHKKEEELRQEVTYFIRRHPLKALPNRLCAVEILPNPEFKDHTLQGYEAGLIFKGLDTLEEQHTILGVNVSNYLRRGRVTKLDVLSENAFLCAFNLPPRIDHKDVNDAFPEYTPTSQIDLASYYDWISKKIEERNNKVTEHVWG